MVIGSKLYRCKLCADSLQWAREHLAEAPDGAVFLADELTEARGRQGRAWSIFHGQLTVTFILKPEHLSSIPKDELQIRLNQLNMAISLGICQPLAGYGVKLKWPNDFFLNGKKCGGMLVQGVWLEEVLHGIIVGFSLNVNNVFTSDDPLFGQATSIAQNHEEISIRDVYKAILASLDGYYALWRQAEWATLYQEWRKLQIFIGKKVSVHRHDGVVLEGTMQQVLPNGDMLMLVNGKLEVISCTTVGYWG